jgi:O-antigen/teichoic acid export membrane protein
VSQVRRNVVANFAGQLWTALMGVIFIPVYIRLLGLESFGLVGFYLTLQALAIVFDFGLAGTINRELARRDRLPPQQLRDLVRTLEWIYWPIGALIALLVWLGAGLIARHWLQPVDLEPDRVVTALGLMGASLGAQWASTYYTAGLNGLQRQVLSNALLALFATLRGAGVLVPLVLLRPTVEVFFVWQAAIGVLQTVVYAVVLWRALPAGSRGARFSRQQLARVGGFTFGLGAIALLSFGLIQADRIVLSRLLPLDQFGLYALAATVAAALLRVVQPWFNALYPRFSELHARGDETALRRLYHESTQWLAATVLPAAAVIAVFAEDLLRVWTREAAVSAAAAPLLALLVSGTALNGLMNLPYAMQLAHGWTRLALWSNVLAILLVVPGVLFLALHYGPAGAASVWLLLNLGYVFIALPVMHRRILRGELMRWYLRDVAPAAAASAAVAIALRAAVGDIPAGAAGAALLVALCAFVVAAAVLANAAPRQRLLAAVGRLRLLA